MEELIKKCVDESCADGYSTDPVVFIATPDEKVELVKILGKDHGIITVDRDLRLSVIFKMKIFRGTSYVVLPQAAACAEGKGIINVLTVLKRRVLFLSPTVFKKRILRLLSPSAVTRNYSFECITADTVALIAGGTRLNMADFILDIRDEWESTSNTVEIDKDELIVSSLLVTKYEVYWTFNQLQELFNRPEPDRVGGTDTDKVYELDLAIDRLEGVLADLVARRVPNSFPPVLHQRHLDVSECVPPSLQEVVSNTLTDIQTNEVRIIHVNESVAELMEVLLKAPSVKEKTVVFVCNSDV